MKKKNRILIITSLILVFIIFALIKQGSVLGNKVYVLSENKNQKDLKNKPEPDNNNEDIIIKKEDAKPNTTEDDKIKEKITVYISGAVQRPGIVSIESDKRLFDAIQVLGGTMENADLNRVNMAIKLEDEKHYIVPRIGEAISVDTGSTENFNGESDRESENSTKPEGNDRDKKGKVNINTADKADLETLQGIGEATADKIIRYREENGKFKSIEDIKNVNGIGDKKFESIRDSITI